MFLTTRFSPSLKALYKPANSITIILFHNVSLCPASPASSHDARSRHPPPLPAPTVNKKKIRITIECFRTRSIFNPVERLPIYFFGRPAFIFRISRRRITLLDKNRDAGRFLSQRESPILRVPRRPFYEMLLVKTPNDSIVGLFHTLTKASSR